MITRKCLQGEFERSSKRRCPGVPYVIPRHGHEFARIIHIESNIEVGYGRTDILMISKSPERPNIAIEFKQGEAVDELKNDALKQIHEQQYYTGLTGEVLCIGIAHNKKWYEW